MSSKVMSSWGFILIKLSSWNLTLEFLRTSMLVNVNSIKGAASHVDVRGVLTLSDVIEV